MATILVVDDEQDIVDLVRGYLEREGFAVVEAADGDAALRLARLHRPDVVVLDLMLPGLDGIEVCRQLRQFSDAYVLMLTARAEEVDKIIGLSVGADDYVTKPFSPREIVARVRALLRRSRDAVAEERLPALQVGDLLVDEEQREVHQAGDPVALTAREFDLLSTLARHPGRVYTRAQLLEQVWGDEYYDDHVIDVNVANIRKKIEDDPSHPRYLETIRGVGYRLSSHPQS